jgi:aminopeptidase YwaD
VRTAEAALQQLMRIAVLLIFFSAFSCAAQDTAYAGKIIYKLCSPSFHGRGYVNSGEQKAARFIRSEFKKLEIKPPGNGYFQKFPFPVNTFPSDVAVTAGTKKLQPGVDFITYPSSSSSSNTFTLEQCDTMLNCLNAANNNCLVINKDRFNSMKETAVKRMQEKKSGAVVLVDEKLTWSVAREQLGIPAVIVKRSSFPEEAKIILIDIKARLKKNHHSVNVAGFIPGTEVRDSFIVFTAHYDHLGRMGRNTYFPGANDNASGIAMLLNLAAYYSKPEHAPHCNMLFIAFAGEEAGLVGSKYYSEHPLFELSRIKFLINLDLLGTGDEGLMVVNATEFPKQFDLLNSINEEKRYVNPLSQRGTAKNSDHYYFSEKGVPSFFLYTMGGIKAYHDVFDKAETLPLTKFSEVFMLIRDFADALAR